MKPRPTSSIANSNKVRFPRRGADEDTCPYALRNGNQARESTVSPLSTNPLHPAQHANPALAVALDGLNVAGKSAMAKRHLSSVLFI